MSKAQFIWDRDYLTTKEISDNILTKHFLIGKKPEDKDSNY